MQQVCGLKWSHDDWELASGGNDNQLLVWNQHSRQPALRLTEHTAAVKAIAWSPHQSGLLASGGGTANRCIRFWNTTNGHQLNSVDTGSQVCNLAWSKNVNEIVSTHGYSRNQIMMWKYPSMTKVATLTAHIMRVLYLAMSPDGQTIVTGAGDETLRFWNVFPSMKTPINTSERHRSLVSWANPNSMIFFAHVNIFWSLVFGLLGEPKFDDILCTREYVLVMKMERKGLVYTVYETVIYL